MVERSADWIAQVQGDLHHASHDLEHGYFDWACFSSQQAAAKAVKALLYARGLEPRGHSVADLLIVYDGPERNQEYRTVRNVIRLGGLEPRIYTSDQAGQMATILDRMIRGGVELF